MIMMETEMGIQNKLKIIQVPRNYLKENPWILLTTNYKTLLGMTICKWKFKRVV